MKWIRAIVIAVALTGCQCQKRSDARSSPAPADIVEGPVAGPVPESDSGTEVTEKNGQDQNDDGTDSDPGFSTDPLKDNRVSAPVSVGLPPRLETFLGSSSDRRAVVRVRGRLQMFDLTTAKFGNEFGSVPHGTLLGEAAVDCAAVGRLIYVGHVGGGKEYGIISVKYDGTGRIVIASGYARHQDVLLQRTHGSRLFYRISAGADDENFVAGCDGSGLTNLSAPVESTLDLQSGLFLLRDQKLYYEAQCKTSGHMCMARVDNDQVTQIDMQITGRLMVSKSGYVAFKTTGDVIKLLDNPSQPATDLFGGQSVFEVRWDDEADVLVAVTQTLRLVSYDAKSGVSRDLGTVVRTGSGKVFVVLANGSIARVAPTTSGSTTKDLTLHRVDGSSEVVLTGVADISIAASARANTVLYWVRDGGKASLNIFNAATAGKKLLSENVTQQPVVDPVGKFAYFSETDVNLSTDLVKRVQLENHTVNDISNLRDRYCSRRQSLFIWQDSFISIQRYDESVGACVEDVLDLERGLKATIPGKEQVSVISAADISADTGAVTYAGVFLGGDSESLARIAAGQDAPETLHRALPGVRTYYTLGPPVIGGYYKRESLQVAIRETDQEAKESELDLKARQLNTNIAPKDLGDSGLAVSFYRADGSISLHSVRAGGTEEEISSSGATVTGVSRLAGRDALMFSENDTGIRSVYLWQDATRHLVSPGGSNTSVSCILAVEGKIICLEDTGAGNEVAEFDVDSRTRKTILDVTKVPARIQPGGSGVVIYADDGVYF
jgi:hypothetical protein